MINIESLDTHVTHAPVSGVPFFNLRCNITIPQKEKLSALRKELHNLGDDMNIDIEISAIENI